LIISVFIVDVYGLPQLFIARLVKNALKVLIITALSSITALAITIERTLLFS
jgi:hypothetical protein